MRIYTEEKSSKNLDGLEFKSKNTPKNTRKSPKNRPPLNLNPKKLNL